LHGLTGKRRTWSHTEPWIDPARIAQCQCT